MRQSVTNNSVQQEATRWSQRAKNNFVRSNDADKHDELSRNNVDSHEWFQWYFRSRNKENLLPKYTSYWSKSKTTKAVKNIANKCVESRFSDEQHLRRASFRYIQPYNCMIISTIYSPIEGYAACSPVAIYKGTPCRQLLRSPSLSWICLDFAISSGFY